MLLDDSINGNEEESVVAATATSRNRNSSKKPNESMMSGSLNILILLRQFWYWPRQHYW